MAGKHGGARPGAGRKSKSAAAAAKPQPADSLEQQTGEMSEQEIAILARSFVPAAVKRLAHISQHGKSEAAAVAASNALIDRGFGRRPFFGGDKPKQPKTPDAHDAPKKPEQLDLDDWANDATVQ